MHDSAKQACAWKAGGWVKIILANSRARESARLTIVALGALADSCGVVSVPVPVLAALCGIRDRQVQYDLAALLKLGELVKLSGGKGGRGSATVYQIRVHPIAPFPRPKRVQSMKGV